MSTAENGNDIVTRAEEQGTASAKELGIDTSRRKLLKGAAGLGLAVAAAPFALNLTAKDAKAAMGWVFPHTWDETVDTLVIGSGFAGLSAAAEAANGGDKVVILEKMPTYGGNSIINGGVYASWNDEYHLREKLDLGEDSIKQHKEDTLKGGDYFSDPKLVDVFVKGATPALNWMCDEGGCEVRQALTRAGGHFAYRTHTTVQGKGIGYTDPLKRIALKRGAKIRLNQKVTWIWRKDEGSPVAGVQVQKGRKQKNIRIRKALIIASGGFSRDVKMRQSYFPFLGPEINCTNHPGATGEIIRYAQAIGADTLHMAFIQLYPFAEPETGILDTPAVYPFSGVGYGLVYVSKEGKRFVNELERRDVCSFAQIKLGLKPTYSIFNEEMIEKMAGSKEEVEKGIQRKRFIKADSLAGLAGKLGLPIDQTVATIKKHNDYISSGKDPDFSKPMTKKMIPLQKGPFYGIAQWPSCHHCMGGLRITPEAQVIDIWGKPIPRLYAAGEVTGGVHGSNRLGSNAIPDCISFGRVAGIDASKQKPLV